MGRYFSSYPFTVRLYRSFRPIVKIYSLLSGLHLDFLIFIRLANLVPSKVFNVSCGLSKVSFRLFLLSMVPSIILYQFIYLGGASLAGILDGLLADFGFTRYRFFILVPSFILVVFLLSKIFSFVLKLLPVFPRDQ